MYLTTREIHQKRKRLKYEKNVILEASAKLKAMYTQDIPNDEVGYANYHMRLDKWRKKNICVTEFVIASCFDLLKELGAEVYFACMEAEHQLVFFQTKQFIDVIMSTDSDMIPL